MISRRKFNLSASVTAAASFLSDPTAAFAKDAAEEGATGPMVGHVSVTTASVWYRPVKEGTYTI